MSSPRPSTGSTTLGPLLAITGVFDAVAVALIVAGLLGDDMGELVWVGIGVMAAGAVALAVGITRMRSRSEDRDSRDDGPPHSPIEFH